MNNDRRARFRDYMRRLDPTGDPAHAVVSGFYVPPPNAVSRQIATRLELEPSSSHLLVGGIGSGKTTELIAVERILGEVEDLIARRVDVPSRQRLDKLKPGVLVAIAATEACEELQRARDHAVRVEVPKAVIDRIANLAKGYWDDYPSNDYDDGHWVAGVLEEPQVSVDVQHLSDALKQVQAALPRKVVLLFDGLDRVADLPALASVLGQDVPALRAAGVGSVVVGPQHLRFGELRSVESLFGTAHLHGAAGTDEPDGIAFLKSVLRARADEEVLPEDAADALARWSGGLLRDLVTLARAAGADAYANGADAISVSHAGQAAERFGRELLMACTTEMAKRIKAFSGPKYRPHRERLPEFSVATELDQRLLLERLLIEVPGSPVRYVLHPTIVPLLPGLGGS